MRIWIDPDKMAKLGLTATDISQRDSGPEPPESGGRHWASHPRRAAAISNIPSTPPGGCWSREQFGDIVVRAQPDGSLLRIRDVARMELGAETYKTFAAPTASRRAF